MESKTQMQLVTISLAGLLAGSVMRGLFSIAMLVLVTGCITSQQRPVVFRVEAEVACPDWAVVVEVDGRFYCVDRRAFEEPGY